MAVGAKMGVALFLALASNASLLSVFFANRNSQTTTTTTTSPTVTATSFSSRGETVSVKNPEFFSQAHREKDNNYNAVFSELRRAETETVKPPEFFSQTDRESGDHNAAFGEFRGDTVTVKQPELFSQTDTDDYDSVFSTESQQWDLHYTAVTKENEKEETDEKKENEEKEGEDREKEENMEEGYRGKEDGDEEDRGRGEETSVNLKDWKNDNDDEKEDKDKEQGGDQEEGEKWEEEGETVQGRTERSTPGVDTLPAVRRAGGDPERRLQVVLASLTDNELEALSPVIAKIVIPALRQLERLMVRELRRLHSVSVRQEQRLHALETTQLPEDDVQEAVKVIREEKQLLQQKQQKEELRKQLSPQSPATERATQNDETNSPSNTEEQANDTAELPREDVDGDSGSGDESSIIGVVETTVKMTTTATTTTTVTPSTNVSGNSDSAIISHIYEMYNSLSSMEHKIREVDMQLTSASTEVYRQRTTIVRLDDKVEDTRRNQKTLVMRTAMHGFKLSDLQQFKGQADQLLRTAEGTIEKFDAKLEVFKDRVLEQQDDVQAMRNVFTRLKQVSGELRTADAFKAHDIQELMRSTRQLESRLSTLHHTLDSSVTSIRLDVKTYLDNLCTSNNLQC